MLEEFGCKALITNAYIIKRRLGDQPDLEVHRLLDYDGVIATDSGGYQILVYGEVEADPLEIVEFQSERPSLEDYFVKIIQEDNEHSE